MLSGAGISVSSDIPAFRGGEGLWARYDPIEYATIEALEADPEKVWQMLWELDEVLEAAQPNPAHLAIAELQELGVVSTIITQNVDALHQEAGSEDVVELHGSRRTLTCLTCRHTVTRDEVVRETTRGEVPRCQACGGNLRPDVVFFGEHLPPAALHRAHEAVRHCDNLIVAGTAAEVEPAASLPRLADREGAWVWEINPDPTLPTDRRIPRPAEQALPALVERLRAQQPRGIKDAVRRPRRKRRGC
ncbi:MAG: NAD-dependent protein deacylase [Nitriliruptor sp.]|nr:MAG: NAD-dependent protein deacylase [Nitriliruptor sp.]